MLDSFLGQNKKNSQYFGEDGEAGEVEEYFGDDGDNCAGAE